MEAAQVNNTVMNTEVSLHLSVSVSASLSLLCLSLFHSISASVSFYFYLHLCHYLSRSPYLCFFLHLSLYCLHLSHCLSSYLIFAFLCACVSFLLCVSTVSTEIWTILGKILSPSLGCQLTTIPALSPAYSLDGPAELGLSEDRVPLTCEHIELTDSW